jgi:hypothetical protein
MFHVKQTVAMNADFMFHVKQSGRPRAAFDFAEAHSYIRADVQFHVQ